MVWRGGMLAAEASSSGFACRSTNVRGFKRTAVLHTFLFCTKHSCLLVGMPQHDGGDDSTGLVFNAADSHSHNCSCSCSDSSQGSQGSQGR